MQSQLSTIAEVRMGYSFRSRLETDASGKIAVIQMKDIDTSNLLRVEGLAHIQMPDIKDQHLVREGDLLLRSRGLSNSAALVGAKLEPALLAAPMLLIRPKTDIVEPTYLHWFINHPATQKALSGQAAGTAVKMISKTTLDALVVPLPSLADQRRIVEIAQLIAHEAALLETLKVCRKTLLERLLLQRAQEAD